MPDGARERRSSWLALACLLLLAWLAVRSYLYETWTPADEGVLGQSAERVLRGELPHRDFISLWSGGLDALNALAFRILGTNLSALRTVVFVAWLGGLAAMFAVARRFLSPWVAAALCVGAAEWTLPLSPHPLPSWYTLFLALGGAAAIAQYLRRRRRGWLALAGAAGAASCAVKITGLYYIAAVALLFVWLVQEEAPAEGDADRGAGDGSVRGSVRGDVRGDVRGSVRGSVRGTGRVYAATITLGLLGYLGMVAIVFAGVASGNAAVHFMVPSLALVGLLLWREWSQRSEASVPRFGRLAALTLPFAGGALVVLAVWLAPYAASHSLGDLYTGLFVTPRIRFTVARYPLPGLRSAGIAALPFVLLLAGAPFVRRPLRAADRWALWLAIGALAAFTYEGSPTILLLWYGFRLLTPACAVIGAWWLGTTDPRLAIPMERRALVFFLIAAASACSLVQVPFALYTYFLYFVPLLLLALTALLTSQPAMPRDIPAALLTFLLWFGFWQPASIKRTPAVRGHGSLAALAMPRGGISVVPEDSATYGDLYAAVHRHQPGDWIYVWHDAPEVYFLTGTRNPTRTLFEAFDDPASRSTAYLRKALASHDVRVVVLTPPDGVMRPMAPDFRAWIDSTYPGREQVHRFEVRWREAGTRAGGAGVP